MKTTIPNGLRRVWSRFRGPVQPAVPGVLGSPGAAVEPTVLDKLQADLLERGDSAAVLEPLFARLAHGPAAQDRYEALSWLLTEHPQPHNVNNLLGREEFRRGAEVMRAYPSYVLMDVSNICTVECRFCKYTHDFMNKKWITLEQIQTCEWFRNLTYLNFTAGTAEALSNPQFVPIFEYVHSTYPHLILGLLTNGRTLHEKILRVLEGRLHELHVSMNACNEADYDRIIANGSWALFRRNMESVRTMLSRGRKPWLQASFVKMRWNLDSAVEELEFAADHGADKVLFHHFYPHYIQDLYDSDAKRRAEKFGPEQSLYFEPERSDEVFARVRERAAELGVEVETPPPFTAQTHITWGARTLAAPPESCAYPWTHMFMLWGWKSRREEITMCCGLASDTGINFEWETVFTRDGLFDIWNSPTMQAYRRTVNGGRVNPICAMCRKIDKYNPHAVYPDQRDFFTFNSLPVPKHLEKKPAGELPVIGGGGGCGC